jgi:hypothetical protein
MFLYPVRILVILVYITSSFRQYQSAEKKRYENLVLQWSVDDMINTEPNPFEQHQVPTESSEISPVEYTTNPMSFKYKKTGTDDRYPLLDDDPFRAEILYNLSLHLRKQELLKILERKDVSIHTKISLIETEMDSSIRPQIEAGGLFDDWEKDVA